MGYNSAKEVLEALVHSYYEERSVEGILSCVTDDIEWIGTEDYDSASGKAALKQLLENDVEAFPEAFQVEIDEPVMQAYGKDVVLVTVNGRQLAVPEVICGFNIRGTACCVRNDNGWLISNVHTSVPNYQMEKYSLEREIDEKNKKEKLLLAGIPGGVAIYRVKKNGIVLTDYVSNGLAKMCGYKSGEEFRAYLKEDAMVNVVKEDIPILRKAIEECLTNNKPISVMYRIHVKDAPDILQRLDANTMDTELAEDELGAWYAVHTIVSDSSKEIMYNQKKLQTLMDNAPVGISVYELDNNGVSLSYVNDAFYKMLGSDRESRKAFFAGGTINAIYAEDIPRVKKVISDVLKGADNLNVNYRLILDSGELFWVNLTGTVIERRENYAKVYAAFADFNSIMQTQKHEQDIRQTFSIAMQSAKILAWNYDCRTRTITDTMTLGEAFNLPHTLSNAPETLSEKVFVAEEDKEPLRQFMDNLSTTQVDTIDLKGRPSADGNAQWYRIIYTPVNDAQGNYRGSIGTALDITEQKERERHYEEQLRLNMLNTQNVLSKIYVNLTKNEIIFYDHNADAYLHHPNINSADDLLRCVNQVISDKDELKKFEIVADCQTIIKAFSQGKNHFEIICHFNDVLKWTKVTYDVLLNPYTGDLEMSSYITDVSEQRRSELVVNKLMDVAYESILLIDCNTGLSSPLKQVNNQYPAEINDFILEGGSQAAGLEKFYRKYVPATDVEDVIRSNSSEVIMAALEKQPHYETLYALVDNGKLSRYKAMYTYLEKDKKILLSATQDVTAIYENDMRQKHELEAALKKADIANKAKTAFLSRISHDMRTPLNGILGLTTLVKDSVFDESVLRDLNELEISGKYLLNLINDTLDVSRIESGKLELHPIVCEGKTFYNNTISLVKTTVEAKKLHYSFNCDRIPFTILYDDIARYEQIIMNIVSNAVKFTPEGGTINITLKHVSLVKGVITDELIVEDTGIGMSEEFLPHIFEAFSQEDATRTSSVHGTGLGMSITKQLLEIMGGDIAVESKLGKGTRFTVTMKFHIATKEQIADWKKNSVVVSDTHGLTNKKILVCEDHPINAKIVSRLLTSKGAKVDVAENGQRGYEMFKQSQDNYYDAVLMDIRMPIMDGLDTAKAIRNLHRLDARLIPIIAMTANAFKDDVEQTKNSGMDAHLSKPIETEVLYSTLLELLKTDMSHKRRKILVVDDMEINRAVIRSSLETDYDIVEAGSGREALDILHKQSGIDAVITDIIMPGMNGLELVKLIRQDDTYKHMVIIANTQFGDQEQEEQLLDAGAQDFIYKPSSPKIVAVRVRNALRRI